MPAGLAAIAISVPAFGGLAPQAAEPAAAPRGVCAVPEWPLEARRYEIEGRTRLSFRISPEGRIVDAAVDRSSGWALLDEASLRALHTCTYTAQQAAEAQGKQFKVLHVWELEGRRVAPSLVPGSCAPSERFAGFVPMERGPTDGTSVRVRMLINAKGEPVRVRAEPGPFGQEEVQRVLRYVETCRFSYDPQAKGQRTDTMSGRVHFR